MPCGCSKPRPRAAVAPAPRQVKFEVATSSGIRRFDTVTDAKRERRDGAIIRTVRA